MCISDTLMQQDAEIQYPHYCAMKVASVKDKSTFHSRKPQHTATRLSEDLSNLGNKSGNSLIYIKTL
jgi:hypothetical protein